MGEDGYRLWREERRRIVVGGGGPNSLSTAGRHHSSSHHRQRSRSLMRFVSPSSSHHHHHPHSQPQSHHHHQQLHHHHHRPHSRPHSRSRSEDSFPTSHSCNNLSTVSYSVKIHVMKLLTLDEIRVKLVCRILSPDVEPRWGLLPGESPAPITTWNLLHAGAAYGTRLPTLFPQPWRLSAPSSFTPV
ncbi:hypothetical protein K435DRAFT_877176 [Dendrothele bispora CBS 962.96]|uniref:Uncharacterized protein n=1 Tax=Dendrothele bispora (strain CBS 962.96) TaxID=1314807 RepID=A0A4S8KQG1_DENBC|nr:hypothetical protein K435DRAFT_877176 [Dendrothele bispora CBS 962.96]